MAIRNASWLVGLDLFNDDTCPSGHISRPTQVNVSQDLLSFSKKNLPIQVNVSQSCFHSLNNFSSLVILSTSGG